MSVTPKHLQQDSSKDKKIPKNLWADSLTSIVANNTDSFSNKVETKERYLKLSFELHMEVTACLHIQIHTHTNTTHTHRDTTYTNIQIQHTHTDTTHTERDTTRTHIQIQQHTEIQHTHTYRYNTHAKLL